MSTMRDRTNERKGRRGTCASRRATVGALAFCAVAALACGDESTPIEARTCGPKVEGAGVLQDFLPPCDPGAKGVLFTASGEALAQQGYNFPPASEDELAFVDGWEVKFSHAIVTVDHLTLAEDPDRSPTDQSQIGAQVAQLDGPWAIDLVRGGSLEGKSGGAERAAPLAALGGQNLRGGAAFDPTRRYAFGFEGVPATAQAKNVNLDAAGRTVYARMITAGQTYYFAGTATFKGTNCTSTDASYDFGRLPKVVNFEFGLTLPARFSNCQNPDTAPAEPFAGEEFQRGIAIRSNASVVAQVTFHTDHLFWDAFVHDAALHFDPLAAQAEPSSGTPTVRLDRLVGAGIAPVKDREGKPLPWRSCLPSYEPPTEGALSFDTKGVPVDPSGQPARAIRDHADFLGYMTSTLGHLNADGLCYVTRNYPSPP